VILFACYLILVAGNVLRGVQDQSRQLDLTSTSERLFAGISTTSRNASPLGVASRTMSSTSRTPQRGSRRLRSALKVTWSLPCAYRQS
jgi:hypothetical protein